MRAVKLHLDLSTPTRHWEADGKFASMVVPQHQSLKVHQKPTRQTYLSHAVKIQQHNRNHPLATESLKLNWGTEYGQYFELELASGNGMVESHASFEPMYAAWSG
jgi:hypothetical protein